MALATGISMQTWANEGEQAIATAWELLETKGRRESGRPKKMRGGGPQMSG